MSELVPFSGSSELQTRDVRRSSRAISRVTGRGAVRQSAADVEASVSLAKSDAITAVHAAAVADCTRMAMAIRHAEAMAPEASSRLAAIGDMHAVELMENASDLRRAMRRI